MSCNSCSNLTLPGVVGPAGAPGADGNDGTDGLGFTGGSYDGETGIVTFTSDDGLGFSTTDLRGADGNNGIVLLETITSPVEVSDTGYSKANAIGGSPWVVPANTLIDTGDTLRLELTVLPKYVEGDYYVNINLEVGGQVVHLWVISPYDISWRNVFYTNMQIDLIKTSDTTLRVEFLYTVDQQFYAGYADNIVAGGSIGSSFSAASYARSNQTITVPSLITNNTDVDIQMKVSDATHPAKLLIGKLYFFKKL